MNNCRAKAIIINSRAVTSISKQYSKISSLNFVILCDRPEPNDHEINNLVLAQILDSFETSLPENQCIDMDLAAFIYTSGSTGIPKGVMLTHPNIISAATSITQYLENESSDIILNVLPPFI